MVSSRKITACGWASSGHSPGNHGNQGHHANHGNLGIPHRATSEAEMFLGLHAMWPSLLSDLTKIKTRLQILVETPHISWKFVQPFQEGHTDGRIDMMKLEGTFWNFQLQTRLRNADIQPCLDWDSTRGSCPSCQYPRPIQYCYCDRHRTVSTSAVIPHYQF
jgi:hypothetical protein